MQKQITQLSTIAATAHDLIEVRNGRPMVSSLVIAELFDRRHDHVLRSIRTIVVDQLNLPIHEEIYRDPRGRDQPVYWLDERAALIVMPYLGGRQALDGQTKLVDAYLAYHHAAERRNDREWKAVRDETKLGFRWMNENLVDRRRANGKETRSHHFQNEARLINSVLSGRFVGLDRESLSSSDLSLMAELQRINAMLIAQDMPYRNRKEVLMDHSIRKLEHAA